jgi:predicted TIM-barrel fold metal-dependent hydrolase
VKIDFHAHIWNTQKDRLDEFVAGLDSLGIDRAVVLPIAPYMSNEDVAAHVAAAPDRIIGFASVLPFAQTTSIPRLDPVDDLVHAVETLKLRGLKLHPAIQGFRLNDPGLVPVVRAAGELNIPVLFHTGLSNGPASRLENSRLELLDELAIMCPDTKLIAGHADPLGVAPDLAYKHKNLYLETSLSWVRYCQLIPGLAKQSVELAGEGKILFGCDYHLGREARVVDMIRVMEDSGLSPDQLDDVYAGNALRVLGEA